MTATTRTQDPTLAQLAQRARLLHARQACDRGEHDLRVENIWPTGRADDDTYNRLRVCRRGCGHSVTDIVGVAEYAQWVES